MKLRNKLPDKSVAEIRSHFCLRFSKYMDKGIVNKILPSLENLLPAPPMEKPEDEIDKV